MTDKVITQGKILDREDTKTAFLTNKAINSPTPTFAKNIFRIIFALTTCSVAWIAATNLIDHGSKYEITLLLKVVIDPLAYVISKCFGIVPDEN